ncbi:hypothetical protein Tco_0232124 [Tanacetum coccineum]
MIQWIGMKKTNLPQKEGLRWRKEKYWRMMHMLPRLMAVLKMCGSNWIGRDHRLVIIECFWRMENEKDSVNKHKVIDAWRGTLRVLTDYIGRIRAISGVNISGDAATNRTHQRTIDIENLSGNIIGLTLWNEMATKFNVCAYEVMSKPGALKEAKEKLEKQLEGLTWRDFEISKFPGSHGRRKGENLNMKLLTKNANIIRFTNLNPAASTAAATADLGQTIVNALLGLPAINVNALTRDHKTALDIAEGLSLSEESTDIRACMICCGAELNQPRDELRNTITQIEIDDNTRNQKDRMQSSS